MVSLPTYTPNPLDPRHKSGQNQQSISSTPLLLVMDGRRTDWLDEAGQGSQEGSVSVLIGGVAIIHRCLTGVEYRVHIENTKRFFHHVCSRKAFRGLQWKICFGSLFCYALGSIYLFPQRVLLHLPGSFSLWLVVQPASGMYVNRAIVHHPGKSVAAVDW